MAKAFMSAKGIGHRSERHLQIWLKLFGIGDITRHFAHAVQIIGKTNQLGGNIANFAKRPHHHCGARNFPEGADMRQARRSIAGLKQHKALVRRRFLIAFQHPPRLFKGPGFCAERSVAQIRHNDSPN